ncbi:acyltransferase family protein [Aureimonas psammosilenae]|uniref:acyltransferase family protein n=1 Tax=Aureimonas psammosilenae TaxID=2495496 RepID=UPI00186A50D5|nr:acyltransferase [Aureimonas psammosilenae]
MILNVQYLRGIAAMMVVLFHVGDGTGRLGPGAVLPSFGWGQAGVDIFFAISGFIIWTATREGNGGPADFVLKRLIRVAPLYWLLTVLLAGVALVLPGLLSSTVLRGDHLLASLLFVAYPHPTLGALNPLLFVGWTLNYEMAFYALFALGLFLPLEHRFKAIAGALLALSSIGILLRPQGIAGFYTDPILMEFACGLAIGAAYTRGIRLPLGVSGLMILVGTLGVVSSGAHPDPRWLVAGIPAAMIVAGAVFLHRAKGSASLPLLKLLGDASYSIYLTHLFTIPVVQVAWKKVGPEAVGSAAIAYMSLAILASALVGILCHFALERPLARLCHPLVRTKAENLMPEAKPSGFAAWRRRRADKAGAAVR